MINNFDHPEVNNLLKKHFIELRSVSPEGSTHVLDIPGLKIPSIKFWSLWENEQKKPQKYCYRWGFKFREYEMSLTFAYILRQYSLI